MKAVSPEEWADITDVLGSFSFSANLLLRAGGNNSEMAETLNRALRERGWKECAYELETKGRITFRESGVPDEDLGTMSEASYWVDNRKGRVLSISNGTPRTATLIVILQPTAHGMRPA